MGSACTRSSAVAVDGAVDHVQVVHKEGASQPLPAQLESNSSKITDKGSQDSSASVCEEDAQGAAESEDSQPSSESPALGGIQVGELIVAGGAVGGKLSSVSEEPGECRPQTENSAAKDEAAFAAARQLPGEVPAKRPAVKLPPLPPLLDTKAGGSQQAAASRGKPGPIQPLNVHAPDIDASSHPCAGSYADTGSHPTAGREGSLNTGPPPNVAEAKNPRSASFRKAPLRSAHNPKKISSPQLLNLQPKLSAPLPSMQLVDTAAAVAAAGVTRGSLIESGMAKALGMADSSVSSRMDRSNDLSDPFDLSTSLPPSRFESKRGSELITDQDLFDPRPVLVAAVSKLRKDVGLPSSRGRATSSSEGAAPTSAREHVSRMHRKSCNQETVFLCGESFSIRGCSVAEDAEDEDLIAFSRENLGPSRFPVQST